MPFPCLLFCGGLPHGRVFSELLLPYQETWPTPMRNVQIPSPVVGTMGYIDPPAELSAVRLRQTFPPTSQNRRPPGKAPKRNTLRRAEIFVRGNPPICHRIPPISCCCLSAKRLILQNRCHVTQNGAQQKTDAFSVLNLMGRSVQ